VDDVEWVTMSRRRSVIFDAKNQHAAVGVGERSDILCNLIADFAAFAWSPALTRAVPQRLAIKILAFLLSNQRLYVVPSVHPLPSLGSSSPTM
jgi:hypothetical protein